MKMLPFAALAACWAAGIAIAGPADDMVGTWECRQPGIKYGNKPPILYVDTGTAKAPDQAAFALEVDGFTREVYGNSDVTADADGWWKITPARGEPFMVRPETPTKSKTAAMELKRAGASYHCLRLPPSATRFAPAPAGEAAPAPETQSDAPSAAPADAPKPAEPAGAPAPEPMK
ncbi:MAG TPA: hypothetical protein VEF92_02725 [Burkholderiales bacterium]|nr:hypothetical protein [Burkholderiales bacterium]